MSNKSNVTTTGLPLDMTVNVDIRVSNSKGELTQWIQKHNKATANMIEGIVKFLRGEFNDTRLNIGNVGSNASIAHCYIPSHIGFGDFGVMYNKGAQFEIDYDNQNYATISDINLNREIFKANFKGANSNKTGRQTNSRLKIQRSTNGATMHADTYSLVVSSIINYSGDNFSFYRVRGDKVENYFDENLPEAKDNQNIYVITELGLFSGDVSDSDAKLLARLVLDPETPLVVSKDSTVVINWILGVHSIDDMTLRSRSQEYNYGVRETNVDIKWENI